MELGGERLVPARCRSCWRRRSPACPSAGAGRRARRRRGRAPRGRRRRAGSGRPLRSPTRACAWTARASSSASARSTPPVSISSKRRPFHSHSSARRSRVTPGSASVTASLPPARRLTRVLLPALGKPTTRDGGVFTPGLVSPGNARPHALDHLIDRELGGVELDGIVGGAQGAVLPGAVATVAILERLQHRRPVLLDLGRPPPRPLLGAGGEEDLERRVRADHGSDVPALGDVVPGRDQLPLALHHRLPHLRMDRDVGCGDGHLGRANLTPHRPAIEPHRTTLEADVKRPGELAERLAVVHVNPLSQRRQGDAAVHRPRVEVGEAERLGDAAGHRRFAGPGGAVDCDHHRARG